MTLHSRVTYRPSLPEERGMYKHTAALRIPYQSMQQPRLRTGQPGPKSDGQRKMGV